MRHRSVFVTALAFASLVGCGDDAKQPPPAPGSGKGDTPYGAKDATYSAGRVPQGGKIPSPASGLDANLEARIDAALAKARALLLSVQDKSTGAIGDPMNGIPPNVGYTAMAAAAVVGATARDKVASDPDLKKALDWLVSQQKEDGSITDNPQLTNYMTSAAVGALAAAKVAAYGKAMVKARDRLVASQIAGKEDDLDYGAFPYHAKSPRPADLSNVQFAAQALSDAGLSKDHEVWRRIERYLAKVQNHSEVNKVRVERAVKDADGKETQGTVVSGDDGGAAYAPGLSYADWEKKADGTYSPRSYGSMTYALLKCLLLAGADPKDARVVAALGWITKNFAVDRNPGVPADRAAQGYYYYLYTASRTLAEYEKATQRPLEVTDASGRRHDWRREMAEALLDRRGADGWWVNDQEERWEEGSKVLSTSYAMQALAFIKGRL